MSERARRVFQRVRRLELRARGKIQDLLGGSHLSAFKGTGLSFREVREYAEGDDPRRIDWNVTARLGTPFAKVFDEERELTAAFLVDVSGSMGTGARALLAREAAAEFCATVALSCLTGQERLALLLHSDRVETWIPPVRGQGALQRVVREILEVQPKGHKTDLVAACDSLGARLPRRAVVFVVSDFREDLDRLEPALKRLGARHDLNLVEIVPSGLQPLPKVGLVSVRDPESGRDCLVDTSHPAFRKQWEARETLRQERLQRLALRSRAVKVRHETIAEPMTTIHSLMQLRRLSPQGRT
ncbi:MAG: hypothetical protein RL318_1978 [Fibrobacterota bacterium]|jgi:uncharacterized protein (DUF58 family)